jgi:hypothetical protein
LRLEDGSILVTPTNSSLGALDPERISKVSPTGELLAGDPPSKEAFFHLAVYEERPSARAIVHLRSTHSVAVSCLCHADTTDVLPPLTAYYVMRIGRLPLVPYFRRGAGPGLISCRCCPVVIVPWRSFDPGCDTKHASTNTQGSNVTLHKIVRFPAQAKAADFCFR